MPRVWSFASSMGWSVPECKAWNTLEEIVISQATASKPDSLKDLPASKVQNLTGS